MSIFSNRLKELRMYHGMTLQQIAKLVNVSHVSYLHWEQGKTEPSISTILLLCNIFNVSADYLLGLENEDGTRKYKLN
ncbi:MAG: helix-turn-helix domain-containing protein [Clostridiales bacterium]|jgi:transcriptional regulator with XRE-family HTH domain|nr:helix-turn-helix domain-containing protein [Clostridiales bacterium]